MSEEGEGSGESGTYTDDKGVIYEVGDHILVEPEYGWTHFINKRFDEYIKDNLATEGKREDNKKPWIAKITGFTVTKVFIGDLLLFVYCAYSHLEKGKSGTCAILLETRRNISIL